MISSDGDNQLTVQSPENGADSIQSELLFSCSFVQLQFYFTLLKYSESSFTHSLHHFQLQAWSAVTVRLSTWILELSLNISVSPVFALTKCLWIYSGSWVDNRELALYKTTETSNFLGHWRNLEITLSIMNGISVFGFQENILMSIHSHLAPDEMGDDCRAPHCLPHQKFTMKIKEQVERSPIGYCSHHLQA